MKLNISQLKERLNNIIDESESTLKDKKASLRWMIDVISKGADWSLEILRESEHCDDENNLWKILHKDDLSPIFKKEFLRLLREELTRDDRCRIYAEGVKLLKEFYGELK